MSNIPNLPTDKGNEKLQGFALKSTAKARYSRENATASSVLLIGHDSTALEVTAVDKTGYVRWIAATGAAAGVASVVAVAGATANYDAVIPAGTTVKFAIPKEEEGHPQSVQGVNRREGLYNRVATKTAGISSLLTVEY